MRKRVIAVTELVLIFPAVLFMTALVLRNLQPLQYEPARSAQQLVMWYAGRMWTLWFLLLGLPLITCQRLRRVATQLEPRQCSAAHIVEIASDAPRALGNAFHRCDYTDCRSHTRDCRLARPSELKGLLLSM